MWITHGISHSKGYGHSLFFSEKVPELAFFQISLILTLY